MKSSDLSPLYSKESKTANAYLFSIDDGQLQPIGFQGNNLEPYVKNNPQAYNQFLDYRKTVKHARFSSTVSTIVSSLGIASFLLLQGRDEDFGVAEGVSLGAVAGGFVLGRFSARSYKKARTKFVQSVDAYNAGMSR
jgi:hypothetical protein